MSSDTFDSGTERSAINVGLVSGGMDSTVSASEADEQIGLDMLVYLATVDRKANGDVRRWSA